MTLLFLHPVRGIPLLAPCASNRPRLRRGAVWLLGLSVLVSSAYAWTPIPAGPGTVGTFSWQKGTNPHSPTGDDYIDIKWDPPPGGAPCQTTALVQTYRQWFVHKDGTIEAINPPSSVYNDLDRDMFDAEAWEFLQRKKKKKQQADDANTTPAGHVVDASWCDEDPYFNGDDPRDTPGKGENGGSTSTSDGPGFADFFFSGEQETVVFEFEVCVYCFNADGTVGQPLSSMKWRWERKVGGSGRVVLPPRPTAPPSKPHKDAVDHFVGRHTRTVNGVVEKFCPEYKTLWLQAWELNEQLKRMEDETEAARDAMRARIQAVLDEIRRLREM